MFDCLIALKIKVETQFEKEERDVVVVQEAILDASGTRSL